MRRYALFVAFTACATSSAADVVTLANGDRISGKLMRRTADALVLRTDYAGTLHIRSKDVASLQLDAPAPPVPAVTYQGHASVSATRVSGNTDSDRLYGEGELRAKAKDYRYRLGAKLTRANDAGKRSAESWLVDGNFDRFVDARHFRYARGSLEHDRFKDLDLRSTAGAGWGLQLIDSETTRLSLRGGGDVVSVDRIADAGESYPALGWGLDFSHRIEFARAELFHAHEGFWNLERTRQVSLRSRTGVRVPVAHGLTANAQLNLDWERAPAPGRKRTDATWLLGVGYEW